MNRRQPKLTASLLCADPLRLGDELTSLREAGVDYIHVDMADGHFVPFLGIGIEEAKAARGATSIPLDVHLLVSNPNVWTPMVLDELSPAAVTFHAEATDHAYLLAQTIRAKGALAGVALNPATAISTIECLLPTVDMVLLMTTNPGFTRQILIPDMIEKIADLRRLIHDKGLNIHICADGNVGFENAPRMAAAGADILVCGSSSIFDGSRGGIVAATADFRRKLAEATTIMDDSRTKKQAEQNRLQEYSRQVAAEIRETLERIDVAEVERLIDALTAARRVFIHAVGRVLLSLQCLGKRLNHLGIECQSVGAMDEKPIGPEDLLLIASGSGESRLPAEIARIAKNKGARLALITSADRSTIKSLSDVVVHLPCPTKNEPRRGVASVQLMSTLFDQSLHVFSDVLALDIQDRKHLRHDEVWQRHANLE
ncbi:MAG: SIS domain-containing protein [Pirellulales bacterium]|nr:SIS domain-containing protein [Pirellulales bacterium]